LALLPNRQRTESSCTKKQESRTAEMTEGFRDFGNPAAVERALVRPVTLRPRLSVGFALSFVKADYKGREWF
jgi:hypothetical protein